MLVVLSLCPKKATIHPSESVFHNPIYSISNNQHQLLSLQRVLTSRICTRRKRTSQQSPVEKHLS